MDTSFIIGLGIVGALVAIVIIIYNGIIQRKNAAERAWAGVITQERQKNKILPELEKVVQDHKEFESSLLSDITSLRSDLGKLSDKTMDPSQLAAVEDKMSSIVKGIQVTMEAYPDLKTAGLMDNLMREIVEQQENIGASIRIFNQNVEVFNNGIEVFPNSVVNSYFNKQNKLDTFIDKQAQGGFDYTPNF